MQSHLIYPHTYSVLDESTKLGKWINEGAVEECTAGLLHICCCKNTVEDERTGYLRCG